MHHPNCVAITGLDTFIGRRLVERLSANPIGIRVVGLDLLDPTRFSQTFRFHPVDLSEPTAGSKVAEILRKEEVDTVLHLAFRDPAGPGRDRDSDHELETIGSLQVMNACADAEVRRLVVPSTTMCYGARLENPSLMDEDRSLIERPLGDRIANRIGMDQSLRQWARSHPGTDVTLLRHCWVMGPNIRDAMVQYFDRRVVPTVWGFDPLLQFVHEEDLLSVLETCVLEPHPGVFNVVGEGVLPLSGYLALAGKTNLPVPASLFSSPLGPLLLGADSVLPRGDVGREFYEYLKHDWVASGARAAHEFGRPVYSSREAWSAMVSSRKWTEYR